MNVAVVDVGSNTVRLNVYACRGGGAEPQLVATRKIAAGLAGYIRRGSMSPRGTERLCQALEEIRLALGHCRFDRLAPFATAPLRNIRNTRDVLEVVRARTGFELDVLSGEREARLGFRGVCDRIDAKGGVLADIGGGSTEVTRFERGAVCRCASFPIGSLNLFDTFVRRGILPNGGELKHLRRRIESTLDSESLEPFGSAPRLIAIGGTARAILKLYRAGSKSLPSQVASVDGLKKLWNRLAKGDRTAIDLILSQVPHRIHTILPGMAILMRLLKRLQSSELEVCPQGLREGYLAELLSTSSQPLR